MNLTIINIHVYINIKDKNKLGLLHKNFKHYEFVSYDRRLGEAYHTRQVIVASDDNA